MTGDSLPVRDLPAGLGRGEALRRMTEAFRRAGLATPELDARHLVEDLLGIGLAKLLAAPDVPLDDAAAGQLQDAMRRRLAHEPVGRIVGRREFWGLSFSLAPATLEPRPDTETVVEAVLGRLRAQGRLGAPLRIADLGTGTGCLLASLLAELPRATGVGVDRSPQAAAMARDNLAQLGFAARSLVIVGSWASALAGGFDVIVSNPPYIPSADIAGLSEEVRRHDPRLALDGGDDGLVAYRAIAAELPALMRPGAVVALEVGIGQAQAVDDLLRAAGLADSVHHPDLAGIARVVSATR